MRSRGAARLYPRYSLYLDVGHKFLMAARKRKKSKASNYVMSLDEKVRTIVFPGTRSSACHNETGACYGWQDPL